MQLEPLKEAPNPVEEDLRADIEAALLNQYHNYLKTNQTIMVSATTGSSAAWLMMRIGNEQNAHIFEFFCRDSDPTLEGALGIIIDFADGVLQEFLTNENVWLPIDLTPYNFENHQVYAAQEFRNFELDKAADEMLDVNRQ